jgi:heme exporter protein B
MTTSFNLQPAPQPLSYRKSFSLIFKRDLTIAFRHKDDILNPLAFFIMVITLFPLGLGPEPSLLSQIAPGIMGCRTFINTIIVGPIV